MCFMSAPKVSTPTLPPPPAPPPAPPTIADTRTASNADARRAEELKRLKAKGGTVLTNPLGLDDGMTEGQNTTLLTEK